MAGRRQWAWLGRLRRQPRVMCFHEVFTQERLIGFVLIWSALALYAAEGLYKRN